MASAPSWGYDVSVNEEALKWFKLLLIDDKDQPECLRNSSQLLSARSTMKQAGKFPVEITADYLRLLWSHSLENIGRAVGKQMLDIAKFVVVVTLPAIWPHYAQMRMREAVKLAGILDERAGGQTLLSFVSEPEAAALATMDDMSDRADIKVSESKKVFGIFSSKWDAFRRAIISLCVMLEAAQ